MRLMRRLPKAVAAEPVAVSETSGVLTEKDRQESSLASLRTAAEEATAAVEEARAAKLRAVALDVAFSNQDALRFYLREGFAALAERRHPTSRGLQAGGSIRMERRISG